MAKATPFAFLSEIASEYRQASPQLPMEHEIQEMVSGIGFNILGQRMVAPLGEVVEIIHTPTATRLSGVQSWVVGLANVRGRLLPLFDLEAFFGGKLSPYKSRHRVLILEMGELYAGLVVSDVYGMQYFPKTLETVELSDELSNLDPYSKGSYDFNGFVWTTFSPYRLIGDPRFFNAAAA
jgi:twitching motility protein PilI